MEKNSYDKLREIERKENDMKEREVALMQREKRVKEREEVLSVSQGNVGNTVAGETVAAGNTSGVNFLESLPVAENDFKVWDTMLARKRDDMVKNLTFLLKVVHSHFVLDTLLPWHKLEGGEGFYQGMY